MHNTLLYIHIFIIEKTLWYLQNMKNLQHLSATPEAS